MVEVAPAPVAVGADPEPVGPVETEAAVTSKSKRPMLRTVGAALGVGALGALGANMAMYSAAMNPETSSPGNASDQAGLVNALGATAIVLGVGAGGAFGASFIVD